MKSVTRSGGPRGCLGQARVAGRVVGWWGASRVGGVGGGREGMTRTRSAADGVLARMGGSAGRPGLAPDGGEIALAWPELATDGLGAALEGGEVAFDGGVIAAYVSGIAVVGSDVAPCGSAAALDASSVASYCIDLAFCAHAVAFCYSVIIADPDNAAAMAGKARTEPEKATAWLEKAVATLGKADTAAKKAEAEAKKAVAMPEEAVINAS